MFGRRGAKLYFRRRVTLDCYFINEIMQETKRFSSRIKSISVRKVFIATDAIGNAGGTFTGAEYALTLGAGREYAERFHYGVNFTYLTSHLESYTASGATVTFAGCYHDSAQGLTATVEFKNVGTQFK